MIFNYFDVVVEGVEFLIAVGSIIGILGLMVGIVGVMVSGQFLRHKMIKIVVFSMLLLIVCGMYTGIKYFRIRI